MIQLSTQWSIVFKRQPCPVQTLLKSPRCQQRMVVLPCMSNNTIKLLWLSSLNETTQWQTRTTLSIWLWGQEGYKTWQIQSKRLEISFWSMKTFHRELQAMKVPIMNIRLTQFRRDHALTQLTFSKVGRSKMSSILLKTALLKMEMRLKDRTMDHLFWLSCLCLKAFLACREAISIMFLNKRLQTCHTSFMATHLAIRLVIPVESSHTQPENTP